MTGSSHATRGGARSAVRPVAAAAMALAMVSPGQAQERPSVAPKNMQAIAPGLARYTDEVLFGDVWVRNELSPRDRSFVTLSVLVSTGKTAQLGGHLNRGLTNGIKPAEIAGLVTHLAFYAGWPNAVSALNVVEKTFADRKFDTSELRQGLEPASSSTALRTRQVPVQDSPGIFAPKLTQLTSDVLLGSLWERSDLSRRDRSLITIAALAANGDGDQLEEHLRRGLANGLNQSDIGEAITHLAFYAGWPKALAAAEIARNLFGSRQQAVNETPSGVQVIPAGQKPSTGPASNFAGAVAVSSAFKGTGEARLGGATVTFQPGAHTNWHVHPLGQLLFVTEGAGWVQVEGDVAKAIREGDTVWIPPGMKHWHGAARRSLMRHAAVSEALNGTSVTWLEPVSTEQYESLR